jgi:hypothetical protein
MLTKTDWKKLKETFATKEELKEFKTEILAAIISFKDVILHEIQGLREDVTIVTGYKDQIEDHETRIETIEKRLQIPQ